MNQIISIATVFLIIGTSYGDEEDGNKLLKQNTTIHPRNGFRFEDDTEFSAQNDINPIKFEDEADLPFKFEETSLSDHRENSGPVTFQDDNKIEDTGHKKKKRRRRRKPRYQVQGQYPGAPGQGFYPGYPGQPLPGQALYPVAPSQGYPDGVPGFGPEGIRPAGQFNRPPRRRPKQSFASEALSTVTGALTSIALYDDYQCVPRLLCEAAGGGALGSSNVLQSVAGLQPLLTLLSAYSGISTSPLFVFGRAVFLGMTSKGNTASCRYAYPQCPTDPEQLVHYLNNHNGGFFRFFNAPQQQIPQNLEQFYNQLSGYGFAQSNQQNYGLYNPQNPGHQPSNPQLNQNPQNQYGSQDPQNYQNGQYGFYNPQNNQNPQQYGLYDPQLNYPTPGQQFGPQNPPQNPQQFGYYQQSSAQQNYGLYNPQYYQTPQPNPYGLYNQFSGSQNPYANKFGYGYHKKRKPNKGKYGFGNVYYKDSGAEGNRIEKRIQNKPNYVYIDSHTDNEDEGTVRNFKWIFPADYDKSGASSNNVRGGKNLKFPHETSTAEIVDNNSNKRKSKSIVFPESQGIKYINYYDDPPVNNEDYNINNQNYNVGNTVAAINYNNYGHFVNGNSNQYLNNNGFNEDDEVQTVYIVRDDPNNPEIVKTRRGQRIQ